MTTPATGAPEPLLDVRDLTITTRDGTPILRDASLQVRTGRTHAIMGESGSGKTSLALATLGHLRSGLQHSGGTITVAGHNVLALRRAGLRAYRRRTVAYLPQDPLLALTPHLTIRETLTEIAEQSDARLLELLGSVGLDPHPSILGRLPRQFSGGQRRRIAIARALAGRPRLLILDEPTAGLDNNAISDVLDVLTGLQDESDLTVLLITHDLAVAEDGADEISILDRGSIVETIPRHALRLTSHAAVTSGLIDAYELRPAAGTRHDTTLADLPVLELRDLTVRTPTGEPVVENLHLTVSRGQGTAIIGASGVGKTTLVRCILGLDTPMAGRIDLVAEAPDGQIVRQSLAPSMPHRTPEQRRAIQAITQDPAAGLNPVLTVRTQLRRAIHRTEPHLTKAQTTARIRELLDAVHLPETVLARRPLSLSGGQAQRIAIARALAHRPRALICDETTSALDPTVQQEVLDTLNTVRRSQGVALLMVTHSPAVAAYTTQHALALQAHAPIRRDIPGI